MGALSLIPPGRGALCVEPCDHETCRLVRDVAARPCMLCKKPLGFGTAVYCYPTRLGHADGLDDAHAKAVNRLIDGLAEFVAKLYFDGKLPDLSSDEGSRI